MTESAIKIVVAEDDTMILETTVELLATMGFETLSAVNAYEAVGHVMRNNVDVIYCDVDMPGDTDGIRLAASKGLARTPPALACTFHTHFGFLDQSGRAVVCRADAQAVATWRPSFHRRTGSRHRRVYYDEQRETQAIQMGEIR